MQAVKCFIDAVKPSLLVELTKSDASVCILLYNVMLMIFFLMNTNNIKGY